MKIKRILSSVLVAVMLFTTVISVLPISAGAAYSESTSTNVTLPTDKTYEDILIEAFYYDFDTAEEMLDYETAQGYIDSFKLGTYSLHINRYTGYLYYVNDITGQILTSNPYDMSGIKVNFANPANPSLTDINGEPLYKLTSQLNIILDEITTAKRDDYTLYSSNYAAAFGQINVSRIDNGFRLNYTIGDTSTRFLLPSAVEGTKYEEYILLPIIEEYIALVEAYCSHELIDYLTEADLTDAEKDKYKVISQTNANKFKRVVTNFFEEDTYNRLSVRNRSGLINTDALEAFLNATRTLYQGIYKSSSTEYSELSELSKNIMYFGCNMVYEQKDPSLFIELIEKAQSPDEVNIYKANLNDMFTVYPVTGSIDAEGNITEGTPIYVLVSNSVEEPFEKVNPTKARQYSELIRKYAPNYTFEDLYSDEAETQTAIPVTPKPVFRCVVEYTLDNNGALSVRLPANSISFDESKYTLTSIDCLPVFGAADYSKDGYGFFPDGSGMIANFKENKKLNFSRQMYGIDYCYSSLTADMSYFESVSMPVFGAVTEVAANETTKTLTGVDTVLNGYVAILESGSTLAKLNITSGIANKYSSLFASYAPNPVDIFDPGSTLTVTEESTPFPKIAKTKYTGSYVTKISMLADEACKPYITGGQVYYAASYVGMAARYRDYLKGKGVLEPMQGLTNDLPLYIEALGSMEYVKKILTFPINSSLNLTKFEDIITMYNELSNIEDTLLKKADEYQKLADETDEQKVEEKETYLKKAAEFRRLSGEVVDIKNINFKLTGFANNGISSTYPVKLRWERVCGGKSGFRDLVAEAKRISDVSGQNLGIYPDFDFMHIVETEIFDGVGTRGYVAKQIDNRYATKQEYSPADHMYYRGYGAILSTDLLPKLFAKFEKRYSKYDWKYISLSTFGNTLNSNFDEDNPINRDESREYVVGILSSLADDEYSIMVDQGNAYTFEFIDHIVNAQIDSSHHANATCSVPFVGMVLHSYISYAGTPINYSGSDDYDILRAIESGANLFYVLCYDNTQFMRENYYTKSYYSVDYQYWLDRIASVYTELNSAIGRYQEYEIVDHKVLIAEKVVKDVEALANVELVEGEFVLIVEDQLKKLINAAYDSMNGDPAMNNKGVNINVNVAALADQFVDLVNADSSYSTFSLETKLYALVDELKVDYNHSDAGAPILTDDLGQGIAFTAVENYAELTKYDLYTDSEATDKDYDYTKYTAKNNNVVMVTYQHPVTKDTVSFVLNYNVFAVNVRLNGEIIPLDRYEYKKL